MTEIDALHARLEDIKKRISQANERMSLAGVLHKDHVKTSVELKKRYELLSDMLSKEVESLEASGKRVDSFEKTVLEWLNRLTFDK